MRIRASVVVAGMVTCAVVGATTHGPFGQQVQLAATTANAQAAQAESKAALFREAEHLLRADRVHVGWDGRYARGTHHGFCLETFNGTRHDVRQYGHGVPPGFYLKFCADGNYFVNDGVPFKGMRSY